MGHSDFKALGDLKKELDHVRALAGMKEKKPGIFYLKSIPVLHFHDGETSDLYEDADRFRSFEIIASVAGAKPR